MDNQEKKHKAPRKRRLALWIILAAFLLLAGSAGIYVSDCYRAEQITRTVREAALLLTDP